MLSESRISEIKKRKDAATPGPWLCLSAEFTKRGVNFEMVMPEKVIAFPDAEFLANSITDISDLLAEREELVRALETLREQTRWRDTNKEPAPPLTKVEIACYTMGGRWVQVSYRKPDDRWDDVEGGVRVKFWRPLPSAPEGGTNGK